MQRYKIFIKTFYICTVQCKICMIKGRNWVEESAGWLLSNQKKIYTPLSKGLDLHYNVKLWLWTESRLKSEWIHSIRFSQLSRRRIWGCFDQPDCVWHHLLEGLDEAHCGFMRKRCFWLAAGVVQVNQGWWMQAEITHGHGGLHRHGKSCNKSRTQQALGYR